MNTFLNIFDYPFMVRALLVGIPVSLCAALLGVSLVLKRLSMIGDGLSHVSFGALSIALALGIAPLKFAIPIVILAAIFLLRLNGKKGKIPADAAIALFSSSSLALGIIVTARSSGLNADINGYMFGSILSMTQEDTWLSLCLSIVVIFLFLFLYHRIFLITFDEDFAKASGIPTNALQMVLSILTAVTIVIGMRMMGAMLISSLVIFPALSSMRIFKSFRSVIISSAFLGIVCFFLGLCISFYYSVPVGASIVMVNLTVFLIATCIGSIKRA